ncbi:NAD(P)H-hydrate dehydratase [Pseudoclavibacter sp. 13-3]|uniref:NAD(P)H-hydrate dehydratase n=1 Tax=Pseudoclavibacter sp. 13-3 TaxID=2901228 RepID=UPI001E604F8F|nr:NAD(P)H-hydrate dehydratase [Pseudoclavibacter sp. 13-3]MCD7100866.1 NAD(P)H-hydrate dehydratase [Pseudoclavibacter sp. 13-3]
MSDNSVQTDCSALASARPRLWTAVDAAVTYRWPQANDHKYSRGVLGLVTGSPQFPGAAVLSSVGALHTGLGMLRWLGDESVRDRVLDFAPEAVTTEGRTDAFAVGSGLPEVSAQAGDPELFQRVHDLLTSGVPTVVDAGALAAIDEAALEHGHQWILTPHLGEFRRLARRLGIDAAVDTLDDPARHDEDSVARHAEAAAILAERTDSVVLLKGAQTVVSDGAHAVCVTAGTPWHATAGTGDVLTGVIGALLAAHADAPSSQDLIAVAASGAWLHGRSGQLARGPFTALELAEALPEAVRSIAPNPVASH